MFEIFDKPGEQEVQTSNIALQTEGDRTTLFRFMKSQAQELVCRCNRHANVLELSKLQELTHLCAFKVRGIYSDERTEEDINFLEFITRSIHLCMSFIKGMQPGPRSKFNIGTLYKHLMN